jgi:hypothetical protein
VSGRRRNDGSLTVADRLDLIERRLDAFNKTQMWMLRSMFVATGALGMIAFILSQGGHLPI